MWEGALGPREWSPGRGWTVLVRIFDPRSIEICEMCDLSKNLQQFPLGSPKSRNFKFFSEVQNLDSIVMSNQANGSQTLLGVYPDLSKVLIFWVR